MSHRVALITGASGGIGRACTEVFQTAGWKTIGSDLAALKEGAIADGFFPADLSHPHEISALVASVSNSEGRIDALINNAAAQLCSTVACTTVEDWDRVLSVNLRAPFLLVREALPLLMAARGSVVNVSSVHAIATSRQIAAYAASKGGLNALTRALALDLADAGIRVNAVLPGAVDTPMLHIGLARDHAQGATHAQRFADFEGRHAMKRVASPLEIAHAVHYLADSERASYVNGHCLVVDGAVTARLSTE